jgi:hypothetical protein
MSSGERRVRQIDPSEVDSEPNRSLESRIPIQIDPSEVDSEPNRSLGKVQWQGREAVERGKGRGSMKEEEIAENT